MAMPSTTRVYRSTDTGAPTIGNVANAIPALMQAIAVDGYNAKTPVNITRVGSVATVDFGAVAHGYDPDGYTTVRIGGADQAEYNGDFIPKNVTTYTFDIDVSGTPVTPATGTFTCKVAPLGWSITYSGTNKCALRANAGNRLFFRIDDNTPNADSYKTANIVGYETMTDVDTGTGPFPTVAQLSKGIVINKSYSVLASGIQWVLVGDDRTINLYIAFSNTYTVFATTYFGDFNSEMPSDPYGVLLSGHYNYTIALAPDTNTDCDVIVQSQGVQAGSYIARAYIQIGSAVQFGKIGHYELAGSAIIGRGNIPVPSPVNNNLYCCPLKIWDGTFRGTMRGILMPYHTTPLGNGGKLTAALSPIGRRILAIATPYSSGTPGETWVDVDGPW